MEFSDLFTLLEPALRTASGSSYDEYAGISEASPDVRIRADAFRLLIAKFTPPYEYEGKEVDPSADYTDASAQNYLSGAKPVSETYAIKVLRGAAPVPLIDFLEDEIPGPIRDELIAGLADFGVKAIPDDLGQVVCEQLTQIFTARVTGRSKKKLEVIAQAHERVTKAIAYRKLARRVPVLVTACQGQCLYPGCTLMLAHKPPDGDAVSIATPVLIDPSLDDYSDSNVVVLCPTHADVHNKQPEREAISIMRESLQQFANQAQARQESGNIPIGEELRILIGFIDKISAETDGEYDPNYDAVELVKKIARNQRPILNKARLLMASRYAQVEEQYRAHLAGGRANWRKHAHALNAQFRSCERNGMNQAQTFDFLVDYLAKGASVRRETAEIAVCYFIQKCEVFDEIA